MLHGTPTGVGEQEEAAERRSWAYPIVFQNGIFPHPILIVLEELRLKGLLTYWT